MIPGARLIEWASALVPFARREAWRREWEAEVAHAWRRMKAEGRPSAWAVARLHLRIFTCVVDALWERKETMTMTGLFGDFKHALRALGRRPTFTAIVVLTLALGIGATTAVFTIVDGVLLSPLPFDEPEELVSMRHLGRDGQDPLPMSTGLYRVYREQASSIESLGLWVSNAVNFVAEGEPQRITVQSVTPSFFGVLGAEAALGRTFTEEEGLPGAPNVVVLSDGFWRTTFGADPSAVGTTVDINGTPREIVGVMPRDFGYPDREARLWLPFVVDPNQAALASFGANAVGRLAPGSSVVSLQTDVDGLITRLPELFPEDGAVQFLQRVNLRGVVQPLKEQLVGDISRTLWILLGTVGLVLVIACANVANLLLVRTEDRHRELALRVAVGAGRGQVLRTFMTESLVLAAAGGALGVAIATLAVRVSVGMAPPGLPRVAEIGVDVRVLGFTTLVCLGCALVFGLVPLVRYGVNELAGQLREGGERGATAGGVRRRVRDGLVVAQVALALVLLVGSGLMLRSFQELRQVDPGFEAENVLTARLTVPPGEIAGWEETAGFFRQLRDRLAAQPGVVSVGFALAAPLASGVGFFTIEVEDHPRAPGELPIITYNNFTEVGYLEAMGIDLLEGRTFQTGDGAEGARSVVVSRSFAEHYWPDGSALGRRMRLGGPEEAWYQIVGVVQDVRQQSLTDERSEMVYWPSTTDAGGSIQPTRGMDVAIRTAGDAVAFVPVLRREVAALNPRIPVASPRSMESVVGEAMAEVSFTVTMLGAASAIALALGLVGIYGVISYLVAKRTREIGVRMALGASGPTVRGMVVREGMGLAALGVVLGLVAAVALSRVMASLLFGVTATDPLTYAVVALAMAAVALLASWLPALRASSVDPATALRVE